MAESAHDPLRVKLEDKKYARLKVVETILNTYGFALMGGTLIEPIFKGGAFRLVNAFGILIALAFHGFAIYLAPVKESDHERL